MSVAVHRAPLTVPPRQASSGRPGWAQARRLLAVRLDRMGDVLMTSPALRALREGRPDRHITLLTSTPGADVARLIPEVDEVIVYDAPWMKATPPRAEPDADLRLIERLRAGRFDGAVIFTACSQDPLPAALACYLAAIPLRLAHSREKSYQLLTDRIPDEGEPGQRRHEVRRQLDLVAALGCHTRDEHLSLRPGPAAAAEVHRRLRASSLRPASPWVVIHPGASAASRCYPLDAYEAVARMLSLVAGWQVIATGSEAETEATERICAATGPGRGASITGLTLEQMASLIGMAPLLIANNSGPVHVAAAMGTPVVDLYALTNPEHTPWGVPSRVLYQDVPCRFCHASVCPEGHHACLTGVMPEAVVAAALELAATTGRTSWSLRGSGAVVDPPLAAMARAAAGVASGSGPGN